MSNSLGNATYSTQNKWFTKNRNKSTFKMVVLREINLDVCYTSTL